MWFYCTFFSDFFFSLPGNTLVLCVLMKHRKQTNLTDISLFNLALSDLLFVLALPFHAHYMVAGKWTFGDFMCRFISTSYRAGFVGSIFSMIFMTLDRYMVIMHALTVARYRTLRAGIVLTVMIWSLTFIVSLPTFIFTRVVNESYGNACYFMTENNFWQIYNLSVLNILGLVLPLFVMIACYSRIIPRLVNMRSTKRHRVIRLIICIMVAFFLFWAPYNCSRLLDFLYSNSQVEVEDICQVMANLLLAGTLTETLAYTHCCLNPVIYAFIGEKFMKRVLNLLRNCFPCLQSVLARDLSVGSRRKSSVTSRSSEVSSTVIS